MTVWCRGKHRYASHDIARQVAERIVESGRETYLRAYECTRCSGWHLTKQQPRAEQQGVPVEN